MNSLFTRIACIVAFITVSFGVNAQSINSTLNNRPGVTVGVNEDFTVTLTPGALSPLTNVKLAIVLTNPAQSTSINLSLQNPQTLVYEPLVFDGSGNSISTAAPYFLFSPYNARVTFTAAGTYNYALRILDGTTNAIIANSNEQVVVAAQPVAPTISSTLNGQTILTGAQTNYGVSTTTGDFAGTLVKVFFKMNPAQVGNASIQYFEVQNSTWQNFPIGANGEAVFGPSTGFPLSAATTQFRVVYNTPGVYNYKLSVFKAAAPNDTLAVANESVTVVNPTPPTIFSSVAGDTLIRGVQTPYSVSTTTGDFAGTMIRVFFKMSPSQVANGVTEYYEPQLGAWIPFTVNGNGEAIFGASSGFPLAATSSQFRVTYNVNGTYNYKMAIIRASNPSDTLAIANEHVVVVDPELPTISSTLNNMPGVLTGELVNYSVSTVANDYAGTMVRGYFKLNNNAQAADVNLSYEVAPGNFLPLTIDANGEGFFGPGAGFPLANASTNFQAIFDAAGTYGYKIAIYNVATNDTLAFANESVTVTDAELPTISSTLNNMPNVYTGEQVDYSVSTVANDYLNTMVRGYFKLNNTAQVADVNLSYEVAPGTFLPLTINANGEGFFGPVSGFPLANASTNFRAIFDAAGTYAYKIAIYDVATDDTLAVANESVTVLDYIEPTVESTLDGMSLFTGEEASYDVTTTIGSEAGTLVRGFFALQNASQATDVNITYNDGTGNFLPLTIDANGTGFFGPVSGFPLANASSEFKATFDAAGVYNYTIYVIEVATNDTLASNEESVTVVDYVNPSISSTLNGQTLDVTEVADFQVNTTDGSEAGTLVRGFVKLNNAAQAADVNLQYEVSVGTFAPITLDANGAAFFGPVSGFPLADAFTNFKASFDAAGVYGYKLFIIEVATDDTLASASESVTVVDPIPTTPEISSDLNERPDVVINTEETFTVTTVKNNAPSANVRIKITLANPAQADNINVEFENPASGSFEQLTFDANGVAYAGNAAGFALADADYDFKISFIEGGLYEYNLAIVNVAGNTELADADEEVTVIDDSNIEENNSNISAVFPNPTVDLVNIQTLENGVGSLSVFTLTGQKVMAKTISGNVHNVSLETLPAGIYVIKVSQGGTNAAVRVVKQ